MWPSRSWQWECMAEAVHITVDPEAKSNRKLWSNVPQPFPHIVADVLKLDSIPQESPEPLKILPPVTDQAFKPQA